MRQQSDTSSHRSLSPGTALFIACITSFFVGFLMANVAPVIGVAERRLSLSAAQVGWVLSAMLASHSVLLFVGGEFIDRWGLWKVLGTAFIILTLASALQTAAQSFGALLAARLIMGVGSGLGFLSGLQLVAQHTGGGWRQSFRQGLYGGMNHVGIVIAMLTLPAGAAGLGWTGTYSIVVVLLALAAGIVWWGLYPLSRNFSPSRHIPWREIVLDRRSWWFCLAHGMTFGIYLSLVSWLVKYLRGAYGADVGLATAVSTGLTTWAFLCRMGGGYLAALVGERRLVMWATAGVVAAFALMVIWAALWPAVIGLALAVLALNVPFGAIFALAGRSFPGGMTGRRLSFILTPASVLAFVLPVIYGYVLEASRSYALGFLPWAVIGGLMFVVLVTQQSTVLRTVK
ncbi:MAG: MFS transporter [Anaerolineae bacterium]